MQLEVKEGIKIEIHNKDTGRGCYYPEDDWNIEAVAPSYEKAIELIIPEYINSGIYPDHVYMSNIKYVTYNNNNYVVHDTGKTPPILKNILTDIEQHPLFEKLAEEKHRKMEVKRIEEMERKNQENEKNERKLLEKLKKKYDHDPSLWNY